MIKLRTLALTFMDFDRAESKQQQLTSPCMAHNSAVICMHLSVSKRLLTVQQKVFQLNLCILAFTQANRSQLLVTKDQHASSNGVLKGIVFMQTMFEKQIVCLPCSVMFHCLPLVCANISVILCNIPMANSLACAMPL